MNEIDFNKPLSDHQISWFKQNLRSIVVALITRGKLKPIKQAIEHPQIGVDVIQGSHLFQLAIKNTLTEIVEFLILQGHSIDCKGNPALLCAAGIGVFNETTNDCAAKIIKILLDNKADIRAKDFNGQAPLHHCSSIEIARLLLQHGAEVDPRHYNSTPLMSSPLVHFNKLAGTALLQAAENLLNEAEIKTISSKTLAQLGTGINGRNAKNGDTALHIAVKNRDIDGATLLLNAKARYDLTNDQGKTAIDLGLKIGQIDLGLKSGQTDLSLKPAQIDQTDTILSDAPLEIEISDEIEKPKSKPKPKSTHNAL